MKRAAVILAISLAVFTGAAQSNGQTAQQNPPAAAGQAAAQAARRPPQAKTQPEFDAYNAAAANTDPAAIEKAADDFAAKFPNSEIRILLYQTAMRLYQNANNDEKTEAMGRKVLSFDADNPEALVTVAEVIAERTRDTDIDKDQRYAEGASMAQKATRTVNTDVAAFPAGTTQEKLDAYKAFLLSSAYSILGAIESQKENYPAAQADLQKSIDSYPSNPDPVVVLRLALAIDKQATATVDQNKQQKLYADALKVASRAVEMTQDNTPIGTPARNERDRLRKLTESAAPAAPPQPAPKN